MSEKNLPVLLEGMLVDLVPFSTPFHDLMHEWLNDDGAYFWSMGDRWFPTLEGVRRHQTERNQRRADNPASGVGFGIQTKDGKLIGYFGIHRLEPHCRQGMLSAMIGDRDYWGGGYGTDALLLVIDYAFDWLDFRRIWLHTMAA